MPIVDVEFVADPDGAVPAGLAQALADAFWPGPLTLLLRRNPEKIHDLITSGSEYVAVRIPDHPMTLTLLSELSFEAVTSF